MLRGIHFKDRLSAVAQTLYARLPARSVSAKLAFVFVLFAIPLGLFTAQQIVDQQRKIEVANRQREALEYIQITRSARVLVDKQIRANEIGEFDAAEIYRGARMLQDARILHRRFDTAAITARTVALLNELPATINDKRTAAPAVRSAMRELSKRVADQSNLILASDMASYQAADIVLSKGPEVADRLRLMSLASIRSVGDRRRTADARVDAAAALEALLTSMDDLQAAATAGATGGAYSDEVFVRLNRVLDVGDRYRKLFLSDGRANVVSKADIIALEQYSGAQLFEFSKVVCDQLDDILAAKIKALNAEQLGMFSLALLMFVLVPAIGIAFVRGGVLMPIGRLTASINALSEGKYTTSVPGMERDDEIGEIARAVVILRDEAKNKIAAEAARTAAESANAAKSQFVANMSHELRTPLNAIIGYTEIVMEDAVQRGDDLSEKDLTRVVTAARHLLTLINDILDLSKIEAGKMEIALEAVNLDDLVSEVGAAVAPLASSNKNTLIIGDSGGAVVRTDPTKLRQCLLNLLSNASKFTKDGRVELSVTRRQTSTHDEVCFTVADTGIGMTPEQSGRLFQAFTQADPTITREFGGTGLGLMLTRRMAELLGGEVSVRSEAGKGSVFTLIIRNFATAEKPAEAIGMRHGPEDAPLVLVIDDEESARDLASRALTGIHSAVAVASDAAAGLAIAHASRPALIILDIHLPDQSGWEVLRALKRAESTRDVPVIVLSIDADRQTSMQLGAAAHLVKPATRDVLAATALRLMRPEPGAAPAGTSNELAAAKRSA